MSQTERALELLARLSAADRSWVVQRLSAGAKSRLRGADEEPVDIVDRLAAAQADRVIPVLRQEPRWLICAVLRVHQWPWSRDFLQALSPSTRVDLSRLERQGIALSPPALQIVLEELADRVGAPEVIGPAPSRFDLVLSRLRGIGRP